MFSNAILHTFKFWHRNSHSGLIAIYQVSSKSSNRVLKARQRILNISSLFFKSNFISTTFLVAFLFVFDQLIDLDTHLSFSSFAFGINANKPSSDRKSTRLNS